MKKAPLILLMILTVVFCVFPFTASANFGSGIETLAEETKIIKTGLYGRKIVFSDADFKQGLCIQDFEKIKITKLPKSTEGTLMLAGRRVGEGSVIKRKNIPALVFIPATKDVKECSFMFTIDGYAGGKEIEFILKFTDKINYEPEIDKEYTDSLSTSTQREISIFGKMQATDKENDTLEYMIISYPTSGTIEIIDKETGEYLYTPPSGFVGKDSFVYVARDEWGNFSKPETVNISVTERLSNIEYKDMKDRKEYNAAVTMSALGVMGGKVIGDGVYFEPEAKVTRAEFVSMAMKSMGIKADSTLTATYFDDNESIPTALLGYISTAQKCGIINGEFTSGQLLFRPNDAITKYEAAVVMNNILNATPEGELPVFNDITSIPTWARTSVYAMYSVGIFKDESANVNGNQEVTKADAATYLYNMIKA